MTSKPEFGTCPLLWPLEGPAVVDFDGEGAEGWTGYWLELEAGLSVGWFWGASIDALEMPLPDLVSAPTDATEHVYSDGSTESSIEIDTAGFKVIEPAGEPCVWVMVYPLDAGQFPTALIHGLRELEPIS